MLPICLCRAQEETGQEAAEPVVEKTLKDEIIRLTNIKASSKIRSASESQSGAQASRVASAGEAHRSLLPGGWSVCPVPAAS